MPSVVSELPVLKLKIDVSGTIGDAAWKQIHQFDQIQSADFGPQFGSGGRCNHPPDAPHANFGTIFMNGGTLVTFDTDGSGTTNKSRVIANVGTIQGTGKFIASINSLSGSTVVPGMGNFGSLSVAGNVTLGSNSTLTIQLGLLAGQTDLLAVDSNLTLNASSILNLSGGAVGNIYTVATALVVSGTFGSTTPGYTVLYDPTDITVQFIPEPSTLLLVAFGLAGTVALRRRRA